MKRVLACIMCGCMLEEEDRDIGTCARCRLDSRPSSQQKKDPGQSFFDPDLLRKKKSSEPSRENPPAAVPLPPQAPRKMKILVIDDEPILVKFLSKRLESQGYLVISASDGQEGYEKIKSEKPDLILSDILMPRMTGYDLLHKLKKETDGSEHIPVLIMTAKGSMKEFFTDWEIHSFMTKPIDPVELLAKIKNLLELAEKVRNSKKPKKKT